MFISLNRKRFLKSKLLVISHEYFQFIHNEDYSDCLEQLKTLISTMLKFAKGDQELIYLKRKIKKYLIEPLHFIIKNKLQDIRLQFRYSLLHDEIITRRLRYQKKIKYLEEVLNKSTRILNISY